MKRSCVFFSLIAMMLLAGPYHPEYLKEPAATK